MPGVSSGMTTVQNALSTTAELVLAANSERKYAEVKNTDASIKVYVGPTASVTAANGHEIAAGGAFGWENYIGPIYAIAASATPTVTVIEW